MSFMNNRKPKADRNEQDDNQNDSRKNGFRSKGALERPRPAIRANGAPSSNSNGGTYGKRNQRNSKNQTSWISLGSILPSKKSLDDSDEYIEICKALEESDFSFYFKVFTGDENKSIVLKDGDYVMLKFKRNEKDPDFVLGRAILKIED